MLCLAVPPKHLESSGWRFPEEALALAASREPGSCATMGDLAARFLPLFITEAVTFLGKEGFTPLSKSAAAWLPSSFQLRALLLVLAGLQCARTKGARREQQVPAHQMSRGEDWLKVELPFRGLVSSQNWWFGISVAWSE